MVERWMSDKGGHIELIPERVCFNGKTFNVLYGGFGGCIGYDKETAERFMKDFIEGLTASHARDHDIPDRELVILSFECRYEPEKKYEIFQNVKDHTKKDNKITTLKEEQDPSWYVDNQTEDMIHSARGAAIANLESELLDIEDTLNSFDALHARKIDVEKRIKELKSR